MLKIANLDRAKEYYTEVEFDIINSCYSVFEKARKAVDPKDIWLDFHSEVSTMRFRGNPRFFEYALENLIDNAIKFTLKGYVLVRVEVIPDPFALSVTVEDTGVGISRTYLPKVFDAFSQESAGIRRSYEGVGLGLTLSKAYIEIMNGQIACNSVKGKGSKFTIQLPIKVQMMSA